MHDYEPWRLRTAALSRVILLGVRIFVSLFMSALRTIRQNAITKGSATGSSLRKLQRRNAANGGCLVRRKRLGGVHNFSFAQGSQDCLTDQVCRTGVAITCARSRCAKLLDQICRTKPDHICRALTPQRCHTPQAHRELSSHLRATSTN